MRIFSSRSITIALAAAVLLTACAKAPLEEPTRANPDPLTVLSVQQGDIACYLDLRAAGGKRISMKGSFEICDERWVGKRVLIRTDRVNVQSPKCEGDPECTLTEEEEIIVELDEF